MSTATVRTGWSDVDFVDLIPIPGSFVSSLPPREYEVHGQTVNALTYLHAIYLWIKGEVEANGEEWGRCCHCNHAIRYAVVFEDSDGRHHIVGQDCAQFISSTLNRKAWDEKRRLSEVKLVKTKQGERAVLSMEAPAWFWALPKEARPAFVSLSKYEKRGPRRQPQTLWYLSIWGETAGEVLRHWEDLQALKNPKE